MSNKFIEQYHTFTYNATISFLQKYDHDNFLAINFLNNYENKDKQNMSLNTVLSDYIPSNLIDSFAQYYLNNIENLYKLTKNNHYSELLYMGFKDITNTLGLETYNIYLNHLTNFGKKSFHSAQIIHNLIQSDIKNTERYKAMSLDLLVLNHIGSFHPLKHLPEETINKLPSIIDLNVKNYLIDFLEYLVEKKDSLLSHFYNKNPDFTNRINSDESNYVLIDKEINTHIIKEVLNMLENSSNNIFTKYSEIDDAINNINVFLNKHDLSEQNNLSQQVLSIGKNFLHQPTASNLNHPKP